MYERALCGRLKDPDPCQAKIASAQFSSLPSNPRGISPGPSADVASELGDVRHKLEVMKAYIKCQRNNHYLLGEKMASETLDWVLNLLNKNGL